MLNNPGFGKPKLPTRKGDSAHRQDVDQRAIGMITKLAEVDQPLASDAALAKTPSDDKHVPKTKPSVTKRKKASNAKLVDSDKQYLAVPMTLAAHKAFETALNAAAPNDRGALRRRLVGRARDKFVEKHGSKPWNHAGEIQTSCSIRIPPNLVQLIIDRDDPAGLLAVSVVVGRAFAPYLNETLAPLLPK